MCEFISWIEHDGKNWFLTKNESNSDKGQELIEYCGGTDDLVGHGAIKQYYGFKGGFNQECTDFSTPKNFPEEIAQALKDGLFEGVGLPLEILAAPARIEYEKSEQLAWTEYDTIIFMERYINKKIVQSARVGYDEIMQPTMADCYKSMPPAMAGSNKIRQLVWTEYDKIRQLAKAGYDKSRQLVFWNLFGNPENRIESWR